MCNNVQTAVYRLLIGGITHQKRQITHSDGSARVF